MTATSLVVDKNIGVLDLMLLTPTRGLVAIERMETGAVFHAVTMEAIAKVVASEAPRMVEAVCGREVGLLHPLLPWAPPKRGATGPRCLQCEQLNGARTGQWAAWVKRRAVRQEDTPK